MNSITALMRHPPISPIDRVKLESTKRAFSFCKGADICKDMVIYHYFLFFYRIFNNGIKKTENCVFLC